VTAKELDLSQVSVVVDDLSQVAELKSLVSLNLSGCGVADLSPLVELKDLTELNLMGCMDIADLSPLAKLKNLEVLNLMYCPGITDPSPLLLLPVLRKLHVYGSGINDYDPIMDGMEYLKRYAKRKSGVVATTPTFDASASAGMGDRLTITGSNGPKNDTSDFKFTPFKEMDMRDTATKTGTLIVPKEAVTFHLSAPPAQPKTKQGAFALLRCGDDWVLQMKDQQHRGGATGKLCLFGGWQDGDESQTTNLMRELQEEFGIKEADVAHVGDIPLSVDGGNFVYHVFYAKVPALPPQQCNEGVAVKMSNVDLTALLMKEGIPLLSGPKKGTVQLVFMPAIAEACRMVLSAHTYLHPKPSKA
jgi:Leucine-rich repeat (LRR) protein